MNIKISEINYAAIGEIIKKLPANMSCQDSESGKSVQLNCKGGTICHFQSSHGDIAVALAQLSNLMREVWYNAEIARLENERDGEP